MNGMDPLRLPLITTGRPFDSPQTTKVAANTGKSFQEMLTESVSRIKSEGLTFSKHAQARTEQRGISLSQSDMTRLDNAIGKAKDKGLTDTLVFMNNTAFIVNVPSKVVVTVVESSEADSTVFTNIDGAVIV